MPKKCAVQLFGILEDVKLFTLKFHMLDHVYEDLFRLSGLAALADSEYWPFNFIVGKFDKMT